MAIPQLVIIQPGHASREFRLETEIVTMGRALDNDISLPDDSNISRYHAEIEKRGDSYWLIDLGSSNGSTINDGPIELERPLEDGDLICLGGSTIIEFHVSDQRAKAESGASYEETPRSSNFSQSVAPLNSVPSNAMSELGSVAAVAAPPAVQSASGLSAWYIAGAIGGGLLVTGIVAAVFLLSSSSGCKATVRIVSPESGTIVKGPIPIRVEAEETKCIDRIIYQLDGTKVASSEIAPYQAMLDPADLSGLTPGNHVLTATVEDDKGNRAVQPDEVVLGFENSAAKDQESNEAQNQSSAGNTERQNSDRQQSLSVVDIRQMCEKLIKELSRREYTIDRDMLHQIQDRTSTFAAGGFYPRARPYRDVINDSFINEQGLEPPLGYLLAMSRSNFDLAPGKTLSDTDGQGLWRVPLPLAQSAGYMGRCGTSTLTDQNQKCAAMVAAAYMKSLEVDIFGGDSLYAVACFGMSAKEAAQWRDQLPADRRDLWKVINSAQQRERLTRFFAAGIVGENPQQFGLTDSPLSNLFPKK
jgi:pSer/pThr/pTyr-binding forkhead associated (FHA) protein